MTTAWAHLPNAKYIDLVLASMKAHPEKWVAAWDASWKSALYAARDAARLQAWSMARVAVRGAVRGAALDAVLDAALYAARDAAWDAAMNAAWRAIVALIAYDDCAYMLESEVGELKILAAFGDPKAILLLPACIAFSSIKEMEMA